MKIVYAVNPFFAGRASAVCSPWPSCSKLSVDASVFGLRSSSYFFSESPRRVFPLFRGPEAATLFMADEPDDADNILAGMGDGFDLTVMIESTLAKASRNPEVDIAPYLSLLEEGMRSEADVRLADELFRLVDPDDGALLVHATHDVPLEFISAEEGASTLGATKITFCHALDRTNSDKGKGISLAVRPDRGASISTLKHERLHAARYRDLSDWYRHAFPLLPIRWEELPRWSLEQIYSTLMHHRWTDEAIAFSGQFWLELSFRAKTGRDLADFRAQQGMELLDHLRTFFRPSFEPDAAAPLLEALQKTPAYLHYKVAGLYIALLAKLGLRDFPDWEKIVGEIAPRPDENGDAVIPTAALKAFYETHLAPRIMPVLADVALHVAGMKQSERRLLERFWSFFAGALTNEASTAFLRDDFDRVVPLIGALFGDEPSESEGAASASIAVHHQLQPIDAPPASLPKDFAARPDVFADRVEIMGHIAEVVAALCHGRYDQMRDKQGTLLQFAEVVDPATRAQIFSLLLVAMEEAERRVQADDDLTLVRIALGASLVAHGYRERGRELLLRSFSSTELAGLKSFEMIFSGISNAVAKLIRAGEGVLVEECFDRLVEAQAPRRRAFQEEVERFREGGREHAERSDFVWRWAPHVLQEFLLQVAGAENSRKGRLVHLPPALRKKLVATFRELAADALHGIEAKVRRYQERYAPTVESYTSVHELFATGKVWFDASGRESEERLIFGNHSFDSREPLDHLISDALRIPSLYRIALELLDTFPESMSRVDFFASAIEYAPEDLADEERLAIARRYDASVRAQEQALRLAHFVEERIWWGSESWQGFEQKGFRQDMLFEECHYFCHHQTIIAQFLLQGKGEEVREQGQRILRTLSASSVTHRNLSVLPEEYREILEGLFVDEHFTPAVARARSLVAHVAEFPQDEQQGILQEILAAVECPAHPSHTFFQAELALQLLEKASELGHGALALRGVARWEGGWRERFEAHFAAPRDPAVLDFRGRWKELKDEAVLLLPLLRLLATHPEALEGLVVRVEHDFANRRLFYSLEALKRGLQYLSRPLVVARLQPLLGTAWEELLCRWGKVAIDHAVLAMGKDDLASSSLANWTPVVNTIHDLPIAVQRKDDLFVALIEAVTPEEGIVPISPDGQGMAYLFEAIELFKDVFGSADFPRAEALLLSHVAQGLRRQGISHDDPRAIGALGWIDRSFRKLADPAIFEPAHEGLLRRLRPDDAYQRAVTALGGLRRAVPPLPEVTELKMQYRAALRSDAGILPELREVIERGLVAEAKRINARKENFLQRRNAGYAAAKDLRRTLIALIYSDWQKACARGDDTRATLLLELWSGKGNSAVTMAVRILISDALANAAVPLQAKRTLYEQQVAAHLVTPYQRRVWERLVREGDDDREAQCYEASLPFISPTAMVAQHDQVVALILSRPHHVAQRFLWRLQRARELLRAGKAWTMDLTEVGDWELFGVMGPQLVAGYSAPVLNADGYEERVKQVANAVLLRSENTELADQYDRLMAPSEADLRGREARSKAQELLHRTMPVDRLKLPADELLPDNVQVLRRGRWFDASSQKLISPDEVEAHLSIAEKLLDRHLLIEDAVNAELFDMPEVFSRRPPLLRFLLTRFFLTLPVGEQQLLLREIKHAAEPEALRRFFELTGLDKCGQFLSYWPEVPEEIRRELRPLQDKIPPSDLDEVKQVIRHGLGEGAEIEAIIATQTPLASGTIADGSAAKDIEGSEIVVKVITPTKERKLTVALGRIGEVRRLLELYGDDVAGSQETVRLIAMFDAMIREELDLTNEYANAVAIAPNAAQFGIDVPEHRKALTRPKVAVQQRVQGINIAEVRDPDIRGEVQSRIRAHFFRQVLVEGLFHSDIQPGNILIDIDPANGGIRHLWLLDYGQAGKVTPGERLQLQRFVGAVQSNDVSQLLPALEAMGRPGRSYDRAAFAHDLEAELHGMQPTPDKMGELMVHLIELTNHHRLRLYLPFLHVIKGAATMEAAFYEEK